MNDWTVCRNLLCVRLDNMGDLMMSEPAIRALKETLKCRITVLTSSMAKNIARMIPSIDEVIPCDVSWVKSDFEPTGETFFNMVNLLRSKGFDSAVIFTVFSQNPLPAAMLTWLADIPRRLAYCRENPYKLLTYWVPEQEPYSFMRHQVKRDLALVSNIGASVKSDMLEISLPHHSWHFVQQKLSAAGVDINKPWLILHPGVSEEKRKYPASLWVEAGKKIVDALRHQVIITGSADEMVLTKNIATAIGKGAFSCGGLFTLDEFVMAVNQAPLVITVNTVTAHLAAATQTKVVVLYAMTNPQHTPWRATGKILPFTVAPHLQSRNEILRFANNVCCKGPLPLPSPDEIVQAAYELLTDVNDSRIPELAGTRQQEQHP